MSSAICATSSHMLCEPRRQTWSLSYVCRSDVDDVGTGLLARKVTGIISVDLATMLACILPDLLIRKNLNQSLLQPYMIDPHQLWFLSLRNSDGLSLPSIKMVGVEKRFLRRSHAASKQSVIGSVTIININKSMINRDLVAQERPLMRTATSTTYLRART